MAIPYCKILQLCLGLSLIFHNFSLANPFIVDDHRQGHQNNNNLSTKLIRLTSPLFVFGDSLFDPGNNNYIDTNPNFWSNFLPYGETHFEIATGRFSNGRIIPDFIAKYANLPLIPPYFQSGYKQFSYGVNFASGGAGALVETHQGKVSCYRWQDVKDHLLFLRLDIDAVSRTILITSIICYFSIFNISSHVIIIRSLQAISLKEQMMYFKDVEKQLRKRIGDRETQELLSNAVYMFDIGVNDLSEPDPMYRNFTSQDYIDIIVANFTDVLKEVYKAGGRKFVLLNLLPLDCTPCARAQNNAEKLAELVNQFNEALSREFKKLEKQLNGFLYSEFDFFTAVNDRIQNPSRYGFKEVRNACCGSGIYRGNYSCGGKRDGECDYELCDNPQDYFFFDCHHPSEKAYEQIAELMWNGPPSMVGQYNLKSLFEIQSRELAL
ncbi:OLC1v1030174C1 [Oldenlandia corymbosa var. corymbosa]|uniref:OLC1v1030174C1 n=1 Tax=Oldenlandia corymbosa var. corymbosa TaxID=529605 RepID=A0AAV1CG80_OLDCO|nr:OLC1v1030174C1 [Oldenlandia corymbosa var. corymbosa]